MHTRVYKSSVISCSAVSMVEALLSNQLLSREALERAELASSSSGVELFSVLTQLGLISEVILANAFGAHTGFDVIEHLICPDVPVDLCGLNRHFLRAKRVFPVDIENTHLRLAMANPLDKKVLDAVSFATEKDIIPVAALASDIEHCLVLCEEQAVVDTLLTLAVDESGDVDRLSDSASAAPVIRQVNRLIISALDANASDIHFEPSENKLTIRYRIDGILAVVDVLSARWSEPVVSRVKLMAHLDIAEKRLPQDGRISFTARGAHLDLRVATYPTVDGESVVLRLLGQGNASADLASLGLSEQGLRGLTQALSRPNGIILITGPTGSGKTSTLYAALSSLNNIALKVVTVEDPVEYTLPGISQLQVKPEVGLTYSSALRSILRNDPDVIMIGEIRDKETADIAVRAALTGHLVLATLHTNTAAGAVSRLIDLGVEPFLLSSTLLFVAAQRLVRCLCPHCKTQKVIDPETAALISRHAEEVTLPDFFASATGCQSCHGKGYIGRTPLFEALPVGAKEREIIRGFHSEDELVNVARERGALSLWQHGVTKVVGGETSLDEVVKVLQEY